MIVNVTLRIENVVQIKTEIAISSILWSYMAHVLSPSSKNKKKNHLKKNSLYFGKWNFLDLILKDLLYFLYFRKQNPSNISVNRTFQPKLEKIKKINPRKMELSNSNIKRFLIFSRKKAFLIFQETKTSQKVLIFLELSCISVGTSRLKK